MAKSVNCDTQRAQTALTWLACLALAGGLLYVAKAVLVPLALAVLLTFLLAPPVIRLQRLGLPKLLAVLAVVTFAFAVLGGVGWMVSRQVLIRPTREPPPALTVGPSTIHPADPTFTPPTTPDP